MKSIKTLLIIAAVVFAAIASNAQLGGPQLIVSSGSGAWTNSIAANTTYTTNAVIDLQGKKDVAIHWQAALSGAGTTANTLTIQGSIDRSNWFTYTTMSMTPSGTSTVDVYTNITANAIPYLRVRSIANASANTGAITNYSVRVFTK